MLILHSFICILCIFIYTYTCCAVCAIMTISIRLDQWNVKIKYKLQITCAADSCFGTSGSFFCVVILHLHNKIINSVCIRKNYLSSRQSVLI